MNAKSPSLSILLVASLVLASISPAGADAQRRDDEKPPKTTKPKGPEDDPRIGQPTPTRREGPVVHMRWEPEPVTIPARPRQPPPPPPERRVEPPTQRIEPAPQRVEPARRHPSRVVKKAPPKPRRVRQPRRPRYEAVWVEGYWKFQKGRYVWVSGRWERARRDEVWIQPVWQRVDGGWVFVEGHWEVQAPEPVPEPVVEARRPRRHRNVEADVVRLCGEATVGNGALQSCIERARPLGVHAPRAIETCGAQTVGNGALVDCLGAIHFANRRTGDAITACGGATTGNGAVTRCVSIATRSSSRDPLPVIDACRDATVGNGAFLECVDRGLR
jgi:hypothetical protein